jgi:hypothetical protein
MSAIIGQQRETVLAGRDTDEKVKIGNALALGTQAAPLFAKEFTCLLIDTYERNAPQEIMQLSLALLRIMGIVDAFP